MKIVYTKTKLKSLAKMQNDIKKLIIQVINNIPKKRLRVGKYRVIYKIEDDLEIQILSILEMLPEKNKNLQWNL